MCRKTAQRATQKARDERLISIEERPVRGQRHKPNLIRITSFEWLKWLRRPKDRPKQSNKTDQLVGGGEHFVPPTDKTLTDDLVELNKTETPSHQSGQPTKEAMAFADELVSIAGYKRATTPDSWLKSNPPQVVQVWLNELGKYELEIRRRPVEVLRMIAMQVMERKRSRDPSPPYSPRYIGPEIYRFIGGIERTIQERLKIRRRSCR